jgi:hypothetical protein
MYEVLRKGRIHNLSIKCQLDLLDKIVKPILLYGCEIWGFGKNDYTTFHCHLRFYGCDLSKQKFYNFNFL